jgi:hypothetical protein
VEEYEKFLFWVAIIRITLNTCANQRKSSNKNAFEVCNSDR